MDHVDLLNFSATLVLLPVLLCPVSYNVCVYTPGLLLSYPFDNVSCARLFLLFVYCQRGLGRH
jgi:hypothetical protein